jgi:hypothetical protein
MWGGLARKTSGHDKRARPGDSVGRVVYAPSVRTLRRAAQFAWIGFALLTGKAEAARKRPLFEPTDLEMEVPGMVDIDAQFGTLRGDHPWRLVVPDVEVDVGLLPQVELDVDGAYALEGPGDGSFTFDHAAPDNLWLAAKLGLYDSRVDKAEPAAWAVGAQLGPKLPVAIDAHGIGYEAILLLGRTWGESHLVLNAGGLIDPGAQISKQRPIGVEAGLDLDLDLGLSGLSLTGELAGVHYFSDDPHQLNATAGITWGVNDNLDLSVIGLVGFLPGGDRGGVLLGVSPKFALWK